jgi:hypothetical protein
MPRTAGYPPSVELATLWERQSARGTRYLAGYLGRARITLLPGEPTAEGTPTWRLLIAQAPPRQTETGEARPERPARPRNAYARSGRPAERQPVRPDAVPMIDDDVSDLRPERGR